MTRAQRIEKVFRACCGKAHPRYAWTRPWIANGYRWATDGKICCRAPSNRPSSRGSNFPDGVSLPTWKRRPIAIVAIPSIKGLKDRIECHKCDGLGQLNGWPCVFCDGLGGADNIATICTSPRRIVLLVRYLKMLRDFGVASLLIFKTNDPDGRGVVRCATPDKVEIVVLEAKHNRKGRLRT